MDKYRQKLKKQCVFYSISASVTAVLFIVFFLSILKILHLPSKIIKIGTWEYDYIRVFYDFSLIFTINSILNIHRIKKILQDEKALKEMFISRHDERGQYIISMSFSLSRRIYTNIAFPLSIIIGYFNYTIGLTIIACLLIETILFAIIKSYYSNKF